MCIRKKKNHKKKLLKKYERYILEHLLETNKTFINHNDGDYLNNRAMDFIFFEEYGFNKYMGNENFSLLFEKKIKYLIKKKIRINGKSFCSSSFCNIQLIDLMPLWNQQIKSSFAQSILGYGYQSLFLINTLESYFRLLYLSKNKSDSLMKTRDNIHTENFASLDKIIKKMEKEYYDKKLSVLYYFFSSISLRTSYIHSNHNMIYENRKMAYFVLLIIYILFMKGKK